MPAIRLTERIVPILNPGRFQKKAFAARRYNNPQSAGQIEAQIALAEIEIAQATGRRGTPGGLPVGASVARQLAGRRMPHSIDPGQAADMRHRAAQANVQRLKGELARKIGGAAARGPALPYGVENVQ